MEMEWNKTKRNNVELMKYVHTTSLSSFLFILYTRVMGSVHVAIDTYKSERS